MTKPFQKSRPYIHISLDDVIKTFAQITYDDYGSIFNHPLLRFLKELHSKYGIVVSLYLFYETDYDGARYNLAQFPECYRDEFVNNSEWLKLGFHGYNGKTDYGSEDAQKAKQDYLLTTSEILRFTGSLDSIDKTPRLHSFSGSRDCLLAMRDAENGIVGLLAADDDRVSYYLDNSQNMSLRSYGYLFDSGLLFLKSNIRLELIESMEYHLKKNMKLYFSRQSIVVFTHEWAMKNETLLKLEHFVKWGIRKGCTFDFPMDRLVK